jgi:hypothetical protein
MNALEGAPWFSLIGSKPEREVMQVHSWEEVGRFLEIDPSWEDVCHEAVNDIRNQARKYSWAVYNEWNNVVSSVRSRVNPLYESIVKPKLLEACSEKNGVELIGSVIEQNLIAIGIELDYSDYIKTDFFARIGEWYASGYLPCGWLGGYPQGELVVF